MRGKIIKQVSNDYTVLGEEKTYLCKSRGKFRYEKTKPLVGDEVEFDDKENIILQIKPRCNELIRPAISNVDQAFIITSVKDPDLDLNLLDKLLNIIEFNNIQPIICFTKLDLLTSLELPKIEKYRRYYEKIGYSVLDNSQVDILKKMFKDKINVFTGQTGAGKSSLLNKLSPNLNLKTNEISYALGRGKNTTTHTELIFLYEGMIADTPGFSDINFLDMKKEDIRDNFIEFNDYRAGCKYRDCMHDMESDCEIKRKVEEGEILNSRYQNYLKFIR